MTEGSARAEIGVIGGSGFYTWLDGGAGAAMPGSGSTWLTPFGAPSAPPVIGTVAGRSVAFIPRHGIDHRFPPHRVNYRANLWALRSLGVIQVLAPCAVGSLRPELPPGTLVVPDQVIDRTWGREHTVYSDEGPVVHVNFAEPYCPVGRAAALDCASDEAWPPAATATLVVINGPRFSSRAESRWHAASGADIVGMTGMPEAAIARELAMCYTSLAVVTDLDAGVEGDHGVTHAQVLETFERSVTRLKALLGRIVAALPGAEQEELCSCRHALDGLPVTSELPGPFELPGR